MKVDSKLKESKWK